MRVKFCVFIIATLLACQPLHSQILRSSFPVAGTTKYYENAGGVPRLSSLYTTGNNHTWDFSQAFSNAPDTLFYLTPSQTGYGNSFPNANIAMSFGSIEQSNFFGKYTFFNLTSSSAQNVGNADPPGGIYAPLANVATRPYDCIRFPAAYNSHFSDTGILWTYTMGDLVGYPQYDSAKLKAIIYRTDSVDGFGTLMLPDARHFNVYRNNTRDLFIDTAWVHTPGGSWSILKTDRNQYQLLTWLANDSNFILLQTEFINDTFRYANILLPGTPPNKLSITGLEPFAYSSQLITPFQVEARNIYTNQLDTTFNDSVTLSLNPGADFNFTNMYARATAVKGIAVFDSVHISAGPAPNNHYCQILANGYSGLPDYSTGNIQIIQSPVSTRFNIVHDTIAVEQNLAPFIVSTVDNEGYPSPVFNDTIYIGKLDGPGELLGPKYALAVNGQCIFDSVRFTYPGVHKIIAYTNLLPYADTILIYVDSVPEITWSFLVHDTITKFVDRARQFVYTYNAQGYLSGSCDDGSWSEIAQRFDLQSHAKLNEVDLFLSNILTPDSNPNEVDTFYVKIYNAGVQITPDTAISYSIQHFADQLPVELLGVYPFTSDSIITGDYFTRRITRVPVNPPLDVSADFYVSLVTNTPTAHDTVILWTSTLGDGNVEHRTCRSTPNLLGGITWIPDYLFREGTPGNYDVDLMIEPVLDVDTIQIDTVFQFISTVTDIKSEPEATLYPNPASNHAVIKFSGLDDRIQITLFTLDGREVESMEVGPESPSATLDVSGLQGGLYLVNIRSGKWNRNFKLVIAR